MAAHIPSNLNKMVQKSVLSIFIFIVVYLLLLVVGVGIAAALVYAGFTIILAKAMIVVIIMGAALASVGVFLVVYLFNYFFTELSVDRSHLTEITEKDEPKLFAFIREVVDEVETDFPKKVFLSNDVNASVFYDSSFWSMIFPVGKNLHIGLGLVNAATEQEFKAILAHEFGHFSQRSMVVGSYVYYVNQIIHSLVVDNANTDGRLKAWEEKIPVFYFFSWLAKAIVRSMQWVLTKMYDFINLNYMALSRELEFQADEVAAYAAGRTPLADSLLRLDFAAYSHNQVLAYYQSQIPNNIRSKNIYKEHIYVMEYAAQVSEIPVKNGLPFVQLKDLNKYNKSKLNIEQQWESHPSANERIEALNELVDLQKNGNETPAFLLFTDPEKLQEQITDFVFSGVTYTAEPTYLEFDNFKTEYTKLQEKTSFPAAYNSYYSNKNTLKFDVDAIAKKTVEASFEELFAQEPVDMVYEALALENDMGLVEAIAAKNLKVSTFDYNGQKYRAKAAKNLAVEMGMELKALKERVLEWDIKIYQFFLEQAIKSSQDKLLEEKYKRLFGFEEVYEEKAQLYQTFIERLAFVNETTPFKDIQDNFTELLPLEKTLKAYITELVRDTLLTKEMEAEPLQSLKKYISRNWTYFENNAYNDENLNIFFTAINTFQMALSEQYFWHKKDLLEFQLSLLKSGTTEAASS